MNVLGVIFDSRLNWNEQIARTVNKTNSAIHCISQIKYYFTPVELLQIITSNVYSVLYYNSEIWNIPTCSMYVYRTVYITKYCCCVIKVIIKIVQ